MMRYHIQKETLENLYLKQGLSCSRIGRELGIPDWTVRRKLRFFGIPPRSSSEVAKLTSKYSGSPVVLRGSKHASWKGGRLVGSQGYIFIYKPEHPYANSSGYVREHRLIMEDKLGRFLLPNEHVHHINGVRADNRIDNLELLSPSAHKLKEMFCKDCPLKKEVKILRHRVKELSDILQLRLGGKKDE